MAVNSYLDPEGKRVHVLWESEHSGLSHVVDVILNAPSLAKEKGEDSCEMCGGVCGVPPEAFEDDD